MIIYIVMFALMLVLAYPLCIKNPSKLKNEIYVGAVFLMFYLVSVFRYGIGNDYLSYMQIFDDIYKTDWGQIFTLGYEPGFALLTKLISVVTTDITAIYCIYAPFILVPAAIAIYKYSKNVWISCVAYMCLTFFYASMSFIRQSIAASIILLAFCFLRDKKIVPMILMALLATAFHYTALVILPLFLFAVLFKPTKKSLIIYGGVTVVVYTAYMILLKGFGINPLNLIADAATAIFRKDFSSYIGTVFFQNGLDWYYVIMPFAVLAITLIAYFKGWGEKNKEARVLTNFMLFTATFWLFSTIVFILERFSMYMFIYVVLALPSMLEYYKDYLAEKNKNILKKSEKKSNNYPLYAGLLVAGLFAYNVFGMCVGYHGVFPYVCNIPEIEQVSNNSLNAQEKYEKLRSTQDIYRYLIMLKDSNYGYIISSQNADYSGINSTVVRAFNYLGIDTSFIAENKNVYIAAQNGVVTDEVISDTNIESVYELGGKTYNIVSGDISSVAVKKEDGGYSSAFDGLNLLVFDAASGTAIDFMSWNTANIRLTYNGSIIWGE